MTNPKPPKCQMPGCTEPGERKRWVKQGASVRSIRLCEGHYARKKPGMFTKPNYPTKPQDP